MCFRFLLTTFLFLLSFNSLGQSSKQIYACVHFSETKSDFKIQLIKITNGKEKLIIEKTTNKGCTNFTVDNISIYKILVQSECCSSSTNIWKADTITPNYEFKISLSERTLKLDEVIVKSKKDRFERSGDTLFINVSDDDTRPHAAASTLFDRITGLNSSFGGFSVLGENVQEITVDGKRIFGGVSLLTLESIKANMIEKMEFVEKTLANGQKQNVLNIKLKVNRKDGVYGNVGVGLGNDLNYIGNSNLNKITKKGFLNAFITANSINERGIDPETIGRISINSFRNTLNSSSSIIGLYEPRVQTENNIERLGATLRGINNYADAGLNFTHSDKKFEIDGFVFGNLSRQIFTQKANKNSFFDNFSQNTSENLSDFGKLQNFNANINLRWNPGVRTNIRISSQLNNQSNRNTIKDSLITNFTEPKIQNIVFSDNQRNQNTNNHIFQFSLVQKGKKQGVVSSVYYQLNNQFDNGDKVFSNSFESTLTTFIQNQSISKSVNNATSNIQLVHSKPLNSQFLIEGKIKGFLENYSINQNTIVDLKKNTQVSIFNQLQHTQLETSAYILYKLSKIDIISGISYWYWDIYRRSANEKISSNPRFLVNPFTKIDYKFSVGRVSARFASEPALPNSMQLMSLPDSSNLNNIIVGNIGLAHFRQKNFDFTSNVSTKKGYQFNINFNYKLLNNAVINDNNFESNSGLFTSSFVNINQPIRSWNLNFSAYKIKMKSNFSWFLLGGVYNTKSLIKANEVISTLNTNFAFLNLNATLKVNTNYNFRASWQSQFNILQKNSVINNIVNLRSEVDLGKKWYWDSNLKLNVNKSQVINTQSFIDSEISKFLLKNSALKVSLIVKNLFNTKQEINIEQASNYQSIIYANYLPRVVLFKLTFYPETWKK